MFRSRKRAALTSLVAATGWSLVATPGGAAVSGCRVTYTVASQWGGVFTANVAVTNLGDPLTAWTLRWTFRCN
ncbi:cellulose binding domain-containing protein [Catellatospora sp. NPDC049609]|uniref:cellulose binding domain-containing protein n=1 Tax=Catellatospora sp. NPDC049609 TaxID=3155505 RepID=UPI003443C11D